MEAVVNVWSAELKVSQVSMLSDDAIECLVRELDKAVEAVMSDYRPYMEGGK